MRAPSLVWLRLQWPRELSSEQSLAAWRMLASSAGHPVVVEAVGNGGRVHHQLGVPEGREGIVVRQLRALLPGLSIEEVATPTGPASGIFDVALAIRLSTSLRAVRSDDLASSSRTLLQALSAVGQDEYVVLRWTLGQHLGPATVPSAQAASADSWAAATLRIVTGANATIDTEQRRALADKRGEPGWQAIGRLAVRAAGESRSGQVLRQVLGALRTLEAPNVRVYARRTRPSKMNKPAASISYSRLRLNIREIAALSSWPVGHTGGLPVDAVRSRAIAPSHAIPSVGRVVAQSTFPGHVRPLALSPSSSRLSMHITGPTGTGKSSAMLNLVEQDLEDGRGLVVVEPKDLIRDIMARVPEHRLDDIVVLDPTDDSGRVVGINPLAPMGRPPELVADQLLGLFHSLYAASWGQRTAFILGTALATLARVPDMTLCALPVLLENAAFRRRALSHLDDPLGLEPAWATIESWSQAERTAAIQPTLNKLRPWLVNPMIRGVLGQASPKFEPRHVFTRRKVLLVHAAKGLLGPEAARALGALVISLMWQATLGRSAIAPELRHECFIYVDEAQDFLHLGTDLGDALSQARGLGVGFVIGNQHCAQLDPAMRSAVLANARSRLCFQLSAEDARIMAPPSGIGPAPEDFMSLGAFECYVQLAAGDSVQPWCSAKTLPPSRPKRDPKTVLARSCDHYGIPRHEVDQAIIDLIAAGRKSADDDLSPRRRRPEGPK